MFAQSVVSKVLTRSTRTSCDGCGAHGHGLSRCTVCGSRLATFVAEDYGHTALPDVLGYGKSATPTDSAVERRVQLASHPFLRPRHAA
jgi:hypothetical protein